MLLRFNDFISLATQPNLILLLLHFTDGKKSVQNNYLISLSYVIGAVAFNYNFWSQKQIKFDPFGPLKMITFTVKISFDILYTFAYCRCKDSQRKCYSVSDFISVYF